MDGFCDLVQVVLLARQLGDHSKLFGGGRGSDFTSQSHISGIFRERQFAPVCFVPQSGRIVTRKRTVCVRFSSSVLGGLPPLFLRPVIVVSVRVAPAAHGKCAVVNRRRRRPRSQVRGDHRERQTLCRATVSGSRANGMASQSKVVRRGHANRRRRVFVAREHNLASAVFGSLRCRGLGPEHGLPWQSPGLRRHRAAGVGDDTRGTCRIDAHARMGDGWLSRRGRGLATEERWISFQSVHSLAVLVGRQI